MLFSCLLKANKKHRARVFVRCAARATYRVMLVTMHNSSAGGLCKKKSYRRSENVFFQKLFLLIQDSWAEFWGCLLSGCSTFVVVFSSFISSIRISSGYSSVKKRSHISIQNHNGCIKKNCIQHILVSSDFCLMYLAINPSSIRAVYRIVVILCAKRKLFLHPQADRLFVFNKMHVIFLLL